MVQSEDLRSSMYRKLNDLWQDCLEKNLYSYEKHKKTEI